MKEWFSVRYLGAAALIFVIAFFLLMPHYLGPDDLAGCDQAPDAKSINTDCHKADAIVAISGGDTSARVTEAVTLYKSGWAEQLIFSGAARDKTGPSNAEVMKGQAVASGVPADQILIEETSVNTQENARNTRTLIETHDLHRIILVTSAYHQRRASLEFRNRAATEGKAVVIINHPVQYDRQWRENWYFTPSGWWLAGGELVKIVGFYVSGK